jgi:predicted site-specific integrase-resolvase
MTPFRKWLAANGISATMGYKLVREGKLRPVKLAKKTMITREEADRFANTLPPCKPTDAEV